MDNCLGDASELDDFDMFIKIQASKKLGKIRDNTPQSARIDMLATLRTKFMIAPTN